MKRRLTIIALVGFGPVLAGCSSDGLDDLREYVKTVHSDRRPRIEPSPEVKAQEIYAYGSANLPDPFAAQNLKPPRAKAAEGPRPDTNRRKEPLEEYPLDSLRMVGTLARGRQVWAVVLAPDGTVHRAKIGDHLGQNFGMVTKIDDSKVDLIELVQGPLGDWVEREANLALVE